MCSNHNMFIFLLQKYWKYIIPLGLVLALVWYIHSLQSQRDEARGLLATYVAQQKELVAKVVASNAIELQKRKEITDLTIKSYSNSLTALKEYYEKHPNNKFITLPTRMLPATTGDSNTPATSGESPVELSTATSTAPEASTLDLEVAGAEILQCQALIKWNIEQDLLK